MSSLQSQNSRRADQFTKDRLYYQELIQKLQKQNDLLRKQLQGMKSSNKKSEEIYRAETKDDDSLNNSETKPFQSKTALLRQSYLSKETNSDKMSKDELFLQNQQLKHELQILTQSIEICSKQLTNFAYSLKRDNQQQISPSVKSEAQRSNINKLLEAMENIITMFQLDRVVYIAKIDELVQVISAYEQKQTQYIIQEKSIGIELELAREQLAIFKRLRRVK